MKTTICLWIDNRRAVIVTVSDRGGETKVIESMVEKHPGRFTGQLHTYYDEVLSSVREAESILLLGSGETKGELIKHLEKEKLGARIVAVEIEDTMTDHQITEKVRDYFQNRGGGN